MKEVRVKRLDLLEKIKENRDKHIEEYKEALEGYKVEVIEKLEEGVEKLQGNIEEIEAGEHLNPVSVYISLAKPESHEKDYNQVISMLEMSVDEELLISHEEFSNYVLDDWDWTERIKLINSTYLSKKL